jgi:hypothetical protein
MLQRYLESVQTKARASSIHSPKLRAFPAQILTSARIQSEGFRDKFQAPNAFIIRFDKKIQTPLASISLLFLYVHYLVLRLIDAVIIQRRCLWGRFSFGTEVGRVKNSSHLQNQGTVSRQFPYKL